MKFRASFSILNSWSKGYAQDAIDMYFKLPRKDNKFMEEGRKYHKAWQTYIEKNKKLHPQLSSLNKPLEDPKCEIKLSMPLDDRIDLVGVIDCLDNDTLYEFKTGTRQSSDYANGMQVDVYSILCEHNSYHPDKAFYIHFDQYFRETESSMVWLTENRREKALEWLLKTAKEMDSYLTTNKLYEKYKTTEAVEEIEELI